jgi:hypothetical protein
MTSILFNLSGKIEKPIVEALYLLKGITDSFGIAFFIVGAFSRDLISNTVTVLNLEEKPGTLI